MIDKNGKKKLVSTGEYAPARETIAEEMGLRGKGRLPTEADIEEMGGFEIKKHGGKVKRNMGGSVRGAGAAKRGFGKAKYSDKMYLRYMLHRLILICFFQFHPLPFVSFLQKF